MTIDDLLAMNESPKLDFKAIWKADDLKGELIKDILSIANGNPQTVGEEGLLIFGISNDKQKINSISDDMLEFSKHCPDLSALEGKILEALNNAVTPAFLGLKLAFMPEDEKRLLIITIPPHPYLLSLSKDLPLKNRTDKKGMTYYRIGEQINIASPQVIAAFQQQLGNNDSPIANFHQKRLPDKTPKNLTALPAKNPHFIGRKKELAEIESTLANDGILYIVNGIGGLGKSELANQYLLTHQDAYQHIARFQFSAENNDLKTTLYAVLRDYFYLDEQTDLTQLIHKLQSLPKKCLFVFDDLTNKADIEQLKPLHHNADVLITTRLNLPRMSPLNLDALSPDDAKALFLEYYPTDEPIDDILEFIDYHTLFIELTAKTLAEGCLDLATLRAQFNSGEFVKIERDFDHTFNDFLAQRFKIETHSGLKALLQRLALLPAIEIPYRILKAIFTDTPRLKQTLKELAKRGWLVEKEDSYKLHQVIKAFIVANHPLDFERDIVPVIDHVMVVKENHNLMFYIEIFKSLYVTCPEQPYEKIAELLRILANTYQHIGNYRSGIIYQQKVVSIVEVLWSDDNMKMAIDYSGLAVLYQLQGDYAQALLLHKKALAIYEKLLGAEHLNTATGYSNLAVIYQLQGDYAQALPLHKKVLAIYEKRLGADHLNTAIGYNSLAAFYQLQGDYAQALLLLQKVLAIREKSLGAEHLDMANSYNNLAVLYKSQGDYVQALPLYQKALESYEKRLGSEHPDTATSYNNLALFYQSQGNYAQALPLYQKALESYEKCLGVEHPNTAMSYNNLATLYQLQGAYEQALPLYEKVLFIKEKILGKEHPSIATSYNNIAALHMELKNCKHAKYYIEKALLIRQRDSHTQYSVDEEAFLKHINQTIKKAQKRSFKKRHKLCKDLTTFSLNKKHN